MSRPLEIISRRQTLSVWDGWHNRLFACTERGSKGWYMVLIPSTESRRPRFLKPRGTRRQRPHPSLWTRGEVKRFFGVAVEKLNARSSLIASS
jgi:hypothetical protein